MDYPQAFQQLIDSFKKLPGVGAKSAERMAYDFLAMKDEDVSNFIQSLSQIKEIKHCKQCGNISDSDLCEICQDPTRDPSIVCVVHSPKDVFAFERMKEYKGVYHVLNGYISPNKNSGPEDINFNNLIEKVKNHTVSEVILATDLTVDGEITAMYISKKIEPYNDVKVTRLAHGLPMGAQLDYTDEVTLFKAYNDRKEVK